MALKIDITDGRGVKTRYSAIRSFLYERGKLKVTLYGYVNQATRDAEKQLEQAVIDAEAYDLETQRLADELDVLAPKQHDPTLTEQELEALRVEVAELTKQVNDRKLNPDRPRVEQIPDTHYSEHVIEIDYFEPLSLSGIYDRLVETDRYSGAEKV